LLLLIFVSKINAQETLWTLDTSFFTDTMYLNETELSLVNLSYNTIENDNSLQKVYKQLQAIEEGANQTISIVHIGDSHIQADMLTGNVRTNLQKKFGNAGRGLVFPFKVARTNEPIDFRTSTNTLWEVNKNIQKNHTAPVGIAGISVKTINPGSEIRIELSPNDSMDYSFNSMDIIFDKNDSSYNIELFDADTNMLQFISSHDDYVSKLSTTAFLNTYNNSVTLRCSMQDSCENSFVFYGVVLKNENPGVLYHAIGVNGAAFNHYFYNNFYEQLQLLEPSLVIVSLGTNDGYSAAFKPQDFERYISIFIEKLTMELPNASILFTTPPDCYKNGQKVNNLQIIREIIIKKCIENNFAYWDFYNVMGGYGSMQNWYNQGYSAKDKVHFPAKAYRLQGKLLSNALLNSYNKYANN